MALIKVKVGDKVYELDRLTLGEGAALKRRFGVTDLDKFDPRDPETLFGLMTLAIAKTDGISLKDAEDIAADIDLSDLSSVDEPVEDPTPAAVDAVATVAPDTSGSSETLPSVPGIQP